MESDLEFSTGDYVTVAEWISHTDNSWKGDVFETLHIEGSYVVCKLVVNSYGHTPRREDKKSFDLRQVVLIKVSDKYVNSLLPDKKEVSDV
jgi:hypothetical protein